MKRRSSTADISWFLDARRNDQLELDPPYQRRSVWNRKDRRFFLDTVFRGYPCPPIFLHKTMVDGEKATYAVVDGKQRLQTLFMFVNGEIAIDDAYGDQRLNGKKWEELGDDERTTFWDYVIPVEHLTFEDDGAQEVSRAFDRLNRNMRKLERQELRHARWDGWLINFIENECEDSDWENIGLVTKTRSKRMKDAQFMSELLAVVLHGEQQGFDQDALDDLYSDYDLVDERDDEFDPDSVKECFHRSKEFIIDLFDYGRAIDACTKSVAHFYSLWSFVTLHWDDSPDAEQFAEIYEEFLSRFTLAKKEGNQASDAQNHDEDPVLKYLDSFGGASTDFKPREKRLEALCEFFETHP